MSSPINRSQRSLASVVSELAGNWVAIDRVTGDPVASASTPYELARIIKSHQITGVAVVRAPDASEPELVGLG